MAKGFIITIIGGKGGQGKSQVAANLAFAYAQEGRQKVMLLDFDSQASGDQNFITGLRSKKNIKDLGEFSGAIDPRTLQQFFVSHPANVSYIGMPTDPVQSNSINAEGLGKSLKAITSIFPLTIIDGGSDLNDLTLKALEYSTVIFLVVSPDILAVNQTKRLYTDLVTMMFPKDMLQVVFNMAQKGHPVTAEIVGKTIGKPVIGSILKDEQSAAAALNSKKPMMIMAKNSPFSKSMVDFARKLINQSILKKLDKLNKPTDVSSKKASPGEDKKAANAWLDLKKRIHKSLVDEMDFKKADENDPKAQVILREQTKKLVVELLGKEDTKGTLNSRDDMAQIVKEIIDEALGLGPLEDLLSDKLCTEIMVVGPTKIFYEHSGKIKKSDVIFTDGRQVINVIERIVAPIGRRIDEKTPYVDARLTDGSRVHAIIPPCALDGGTITIRKFPENRLTYKDLINFGSLTQNMADFMRIAVEGHRNIVISGGTGSGKTSLINMLGAFIPANERIITCEDSAELDLPQDHVVRLESKPPSLEGEGEVDIRCLVKQTLRMRPDRIIVGECRGGETLDMLQAMGTGHDGSMTTVHSNNPRECIGRLETLVQYAGAGISAKAIREMIAAAVHMIIQQSRLDDGSRKIMFITEIGGMQGDVVTLQDIYTFVQKGMDKQGKIVGEFQASGFIPKFIENLEKKGYKVPRGLFANDAPVKKAPEKKDGAAPDPKKKAGGKK
ncbi:MAG: Flp pilus assembly complex ATPase component TadA [Halobacteriovoraceae bacterium]|nr:Flp pilus assembly complex ATPase component TadA [Halobacteriovoraceae bacterium]MBT5094560.1 Flp pilus assembly complex ATPase component TadA [Halobacteriovoraceae bacterium]